MINVGKMVGRVFGRSTKTTPKDVDNMFFERAFSGATKLVSYLTDTCRVTDVARERQFLIFMEEFLKGNVSMKELRSACERFPQRDEKTPIEAKPTYEEYAASLLSELDWGFSRLAKDPRNVSNFIDSLFLISIIWNNEWIAWNNCSQEYSRRLYDVNIKKHTWGLELTKELNRVQKHGNLRLSLKDIQYLQKTCSILRSVSTKMSKEFGVDCSEIIAAADMAEGYVSGKTSEKKFEYACRSAETVRRIAWRKTAIDTATVIYLLGRTDVLPKDDPRCEAFVHVVMQLLYKAVYLLKDSPAISAWTAERASDIFRAWSGDADSKKNAIALIRESFAR